MFGVPPLSGARLLPVHVSAPSMPFPITLIGFDERFSTRASSPAIVDPKRVTLLSPP